MRLMSLLIVIDVMAIWSFACLIDKEINDIPWGVVSIVAIAFGAKAAQKFAEVNDNHDSKKYFKEDL